MSEVKCCECELRHQHLVCFFMNRGVVPENTCDLEGEPLDQAINRAETLLLKLQGTLRRLKARAARLRRKAKAQ